MLITKTKQTTALLREISSEYNKKKVKRKNTSEHKRFCSWRHRTTTTKKLLETFLLYLFIIQSHTIVAGRFFPFFYYYHYCILSCTPVIYYISAVKSQIEKKMFYDWEPNRKQGLRMVGKKNVMLIYAKGRIKNWNFVVWTLSLINSRVWESRWTRK